MALLILLLACAGPEGGDSGSPSEALAGLALAPEDLLAVRGEAVHLDASGSQGSTLTWDFGDGQLGEGAVVYHSWALAGDYRVTLSAEGSPPDSDSLVVTVVNPPLAEPPRASGRLVSDGTRLFAALPDFDQVAVVEGGSVRLLDVCDQPSALSAGPEGLAVACRDAAQVYDADLSLVETHGGRASAVLLAEGLWILRPDGRLEGPEETVQALPGQTLVAWEGTVATAAFKSPADHALWWDGAEHRIERDPGPDSDTNARGVPNLLGVGAMRPDGGLLVWGGLKDNTERGLYVEGTELAPDKTVRAFLRAIDPATGIGLEEPLFDNRDLVGAVAFSPMGDKLLVAHHGARIVDVLNGLTMQRIGGFQDVGHGLDGLWTDGRVAWVLASLDRQLIGYDLTVGNAQVELQRIDLVQDEILPPEVLLGAQLFHDAGDPRMSRDAYVSCGSCHPGGGEDGRVWDFTQRGEGLRNTLPIWALPPDGPFHWSANFDELQDFENDIRLHQDGDGYLPEADWEECQDTLGTEKAGRSAELDALAAYMQHIAHEGAPPPATPGADLSVLERLGCTDCHPAPRWTDAGWVEEDLPLLHDVGTLTAASGQRMGGALTGLRTPGLLGVGWTGPWLHDGSAESLEAAVAAHEGVVLDAGEMAEVVGALGGM